MFRPTLTRFARTINPKTGEPIINPYILYNQYRTRKTWPPDLTKMTTQEQLRFEKKYKKRVELANECPTYHKVLRLAQLFSISGVLIWMFLFANPQEGYIPFYSLRKEVWSWFGVEIPEYVVQRNPDGSPKFGPQYPHREDIFKKDD